MIRRRTHLVKLIHIAKKELCLEDDVYRAVLFGVVGKTSCSACTIVELNEVFETLKKAGFKIRKKLPVQEKQRNHFCTERQRYYIKGLWELASQNKTEKSLSAIIKRIAGVDDLRFLKKEDATKVILALRDIAKQAGYDPDGRA